MSETGKSKPMRSSCALVAAVILGFAMLVVVGGVLLVSRALTSFDSHRDKMCIRNDLVVTQEKLRYSPGFDAAMWCKFTTQANGIDKVFIASQVDTTEFSKPGYTFGVNWIGDNWWDADSHQLVGGEVQVGGDFMRVGYVDNGDGTITVYIFWFEV